jgi:alpha-glucosidase
VLSNHDTQRHRTRYGSLERARAAVMLMLALPGSAYLYQGDELGLPEVFDLPDDVREDPVWFRSGGTDKGRDGCRVPLPWSGTQPPFGFSDGPSSWLPIPADWTSMTVEAESADWTSTLSLYRTALAQRRAAFTGDMRWLDTPAGVLGFERADGSRCFVNFSDEAFPLPGETKLTSGPLADGALPTDTAAWL